MDIVNQLDVIPDFVPDSRKQLYRVPHIAGPIQVNSWQSTLGGGFRNHTVTFPSVSPALAADILDTQFPVPLNIFAQLLQIPSIRVAVDRHSLAHPAAKQLIQRHTSQFSLNIPKCHINSRDRVVFNGTSPPVSILIHQLP